MTTTKTGLADPDSAARIVAEDNPLEYAWHVGEECFMVRQVTEAAGAMVLRMDEDGLWCVVESPNVASGLAQELLRVATLRSESSPPVASLADDVHLASPLALLEELQHRFSDLNLSDADRKDPPEAMRAALDAVARLME